MKTVIRGALLLSVLLELSGGSKSYQHIGCYIDKRSRAISKRVDTFRSDTAVQECADYALARGFKAFGVQNGGECFTGPMAHKTYYKYGKANSDECENGVGARYRNDIYEVTHPFPCGKRATGTRIVAGQDVEIKKWPWQAMILRKNGFLWHDSQFCGGSLLNNEWVVTAAHCVKGRDRSDIKIRLGAVYTTQKTRGTQEFDVDKIIIHYGYDDHLLDNDIALIKLEERAVFTETVRPICFPDKGFRLPYDKFTNLKCWITGWGSINAERNKWPEHLQGVAIPLVSRERCAKRLHVTYDKSILCAGKNHQGGAETGSGDSGGPLVCEHHNKWHLEGVTSFSYVGSQPYDYSGYAKVRNLQVWLEGTMENN